MDKYSGNAIAPPYRQHSFLRMKMALKIFINNCLMVRFFVMVCMFSVRWQKASSSRAVLLTWSWAARAKALGLFVPNLNLPVRTVYFIKTDWCFNKNTPRPQGKGKAIEKGKQQFNKGGAYSIKWLPASL